MRLDIVIPAHNEERRIGPTLRAYRRAWPQPDVRFLVALDSCTDATAEVVDRHVREDARVRRLDYAKLGKGGVVLETFGRSDADLIAFVDADGATPPRELLRLVDASSHAGGAIASRRHPAAVVPARRPLSRRVASAGFAFSVRRLLDLPYRDTQCGAKVLRHGRVVRTDEGGDTVSEGQAYAMLLAVAARDRARFAAAWRWARVNLQRRDGLLSWHWANGGVVDPSPASDADLDAAHALLLAARRFHRPAYRRAARRIGRGILAAETAQRDSKLLLVPGPWAVDRGVLNPSYFDLRGLAALGRASHDRRFGRLVSSSRKVAAWLTSRDPPLAPDWAQAEAGPIGPPSQPDGPPLYGFDAVRLPVRLAATCDRRARAIAARMWPWLRDTAARNGGLAATFTLDGKPASSFSHPSALVAAAGAAAAAGDRPAVDRLLLHAEQMNDRQPSYYGAAWVALGRVLLQTRLLGGCGSR